MERRAAGILLMLSLAALLLVGAAVADDIIIRLPGDAVMEETKPCCDDARCSKGGLCYCKDLVEECALTCKKCKAVDGTDPVRYMCRDASWGGPPPKCT